MTATANEVAENIHRLMVTAGETLQATDNGNLVQQSVDSVREQISEITEFCGQVATAAEEQRATTEEMNRNVHGISEVAEATAQLAIVATEHVNYLTDLSTTLKRVMNGFKVS